MGDSTIRGVHLGKATADEKQVRCLPGATAPRDKERMLRIVKAARKDGEVDVIVHLGTNDLANAEVRAVTDEFRKLGTALKQVATTVTFSAVLPVHRGEDRTHCIRYFNGWLKKWCLVEGIGFIEHSHDIWQDRGLYKRDGLHPSLRGTRILSEQFGSFIWKYLN